jgi:hypothetical protein
MLAGGSCPDGVRWKRSTPGLAQRDGDTERETQQFLKGARHRGSGGRPPRADIAADGEDWPDAGEHAKQLVDLTYHKLTKPSSAAWSSGLERQK